MKTIRLQIAYDGSAYCGWQIQPEVPTVEGVLTRAVTKLLGAEEPVKVQGASRTDSGVHATGQVAHFRHDSARELWVILRGLNALTDDDLWVMRAQEAPPEFHARHSARGKIYRYRIWNHRFEHPFLRVRSWRVGPRLDFKAMAQAATDFVGEYDFSAFRAADCESLTTIRRIKRVELYRRGSELEILVEGDAFLKYMVRIMVGTLVDIGLERLPEDTVRRALQSGDRLDAGQTAPAKGLTLEEVFYPDFPWQEEPEIEGLLSEIGVGDLNGAFQKIEV